MPRLFWSLIILSSLIFLGISNLVVAQKGDKSTLLVKNTAESDTPENEIVDSLLLREPETAVEYLKSAHLMSRLGHPTKARKYLADLLSSDLTDQQWRSLNEEVGETVILQLARLKSLRPESANVQTRLIEALEKHRNDPNRINGLIEQLGQTAEKKDLAKLALVNSGGGAIPYLIGRLSNNENTVPREVIVETLSAIGKRAVPALIAALQSPDEQVQLTSLEILRFLKASESAPYILSLAYSPDILPGLQVVARETLHEWGIFNTNQSDEAKRQNAAVALANLASEHFGATPKVGANNVVLWDWDFEQKTVTKHEVLPREAAQYRGLLHTHHALKLSPNDARSQALMLGFMLAAEQQKSSDSVTSKGQGTAHDLALSLGPELVLETLRVSLKANNHNAAYKSLKVLAELGEARLLYSSDESPIITALNSQDRAVQFAAAETILKYKPTNVFSGSDRIVSILSQALINRGENLAVVVGANVHSTLATGNMFDELRFTTIPAATGRQGFKLAAKNSGVNLVVLRPNTIHWPLSQTVANLKADSRTASIPIVIYGPLELKRAAELLAEKYPRVAYVQATAKSKTMRTVVSQLMANDGQLSAVTELKHDELQASAAYWLAQIAQLESGKLYDLSQAESALESSLYNDKLVGNSLIALTQVGTYRAQSSMAKLVLSPSKEDRIKAEAARQLKVHIQKFGLLLTKQETLLLKRAHHDVLAPELANALSAIIGQFKPDLKRSGKLLSTFADEHLSEVLR